MTKRVIVIGKTGQLARALMRESSRFNCQITAYGREDCDLSASVSKIKAFAENLPPCDGIIIAAAYTAVDAAEDDEATAFQVNAAAPEIFAKYCAARATPLVHISTDYVFSGEAVLSIKPNVQAAPINAYGRSKLAGEIAIANSKANAVILRTAWVFDGIAKNFLTTMLRLGAMREQITVVADQIGRPTYAGHLAQACLRALIKLIDTPNFQGGIYHVSGSGAEISWAGFAEAIFAATHESRAHKVIVKPIASDDYPTPAKRPAYSVLNISAFEQEFQMKMPDWKVGLEAALGEWHSLQ